MELLKEEVLEKMKQPHVVLLNILPESDYDKLHILGSRNLPWSQDAGAFTLAVEKQYGKERFFIVYGSNFSSTTAMDAALILQKRGFKAGVYLGGLKEWKEAGYPTKGTQTPQPSGVSS